MMDIGSTELLMIVIVAIVVIGPKDLPRALYKVGQVIGKAKGMARHFRSGIDAMVREVELEEMEKKWKADNERIMREYAAANPAAAPVSAPASEPAPAMEPLPETPVAIPAPATPVTEGER
ncbi:MULTISPECIES: Sec-independent protein translocase protein TatB [Pseudomonadota]|jgi:sec-independent protein translocase protein TatB|uniref:Sec-independent protein translocase protein TatB n=1 Tax=Pseudomonadota TaxID=1224 RepID=UPI000769E3EF|nr:MULTISPECIES: Sec-independent protein translocase protein TatB [Pseudomonadota]MAF60455.1 twin-arginine translocase subunit TatB [Blastomonas sp.]|tara:strand:+ start:39059 stop:39421 length:363 start_codon:yes stop_codon:yes gene_type:complete